MKSIQSKILVVVIAGLLILTVVVSAVAVSMTHEVMHTDADRILKNATEREAAYINDVLGDVAKSSNVMVHYATSEVKQIEDFKNADYCSEYLSKAETMFTEIALNTTGIDGFYIRISPKYSNGTTGFYKLITSDENGVKTIENMGITDLNKYEENDVQNVGWYYTAVKAGKGVWLEPYVYPGSEGKVISYAQPFYVDGKLVGVIGFDMNFNYLVQRIEEIKVYEEGYALLVAKDGKTIYNSTDVNNSENPQTEAKVELKNGMYLVMHADYEDIQRDIKPMLQKIVFAFIIILACSIIYTIFVTRRIIKPLKQLTSAAENLSVGMLDVNFAQISTNSKDEIGTLSKALSNTYSKIQEYTTYINALAYRDSLTGVKNSTAYTEAIGEINKEILTGNPKFGVLVADINNLKQTNDKYGHDVGNELIVHAAKIIVNSFKNSAIFRIGGDEFAVIVRDDDYADYRNLIEKMDNACKEDFITVGEEKISVSVARGIALYDSSIDNIYEDVFAKADHAMYMNKEQIKFVSTK